jgi:hypothetical protein
MGFLRYVCRYFKEWSKRHIGYTTCFRPDLVQYQRNPKNLLCAILLPSFTLALCFIGVVTAAGLGQQYTFIIPEDI